MGIPLEEYVEGHIYRGILTGLNEAFAPDRATAEKIIEKDPNSSKILALLPLRKKRKKVRHPDHQEISGLPSQGNNGQDEGRHVT